MKKSKSLLEIVRKRFQSRDAEDLFLSEEEVLKDLRHEGNDRLLGRFSEEEVRAALAHYGVWNQLAEKGFPNPRLIIRSTDPFRQTLKILAEEDSSESEDSLLCELRIFDAHLHGPCPQSGETIEFDALVIEWLLFQNPRAEFGPGRPKLPGQLYPGLGIMRTSMRAILNMARQIGKEAVINIPEYYHNAALYRPAFRFFSPRVEGRFLALQKFLAQFTLAEASQKVEQQNIFDVRANQTFVWKPHEQVLGIASNIIRYFESDEYLQQVAIAESESSFRLI